MSKKNIAVVYGGDSSEIVVSRNSAKGVLSFIDPSVYRAIPVLITSEKWEAEVDGKAYAICKDDFSFVQKDDRVSFDCAYVTIHGTPGEDGRLQGYFDMIGMPYTTCGVLSSSLSFNKFACNTYLKGFGVAVADSLLIRKGTAYNVDHIVDTLGLPCFIKPNAGGSSFGITKVQRIGEIAPAIIKAFEESDEVIIEQFIQGNEFTCGLYKTPKGERVFPITEVISANEFFDFEAKYNADKVQEITPARLPEKTTERVQKISSLIYDILGCKGIVRVDYILSNNNIFLLEVNTTPGMTETSFIPQQIKAAGLNIKDVFSDIIESSINK
ncbi:D-alanine--D-alanine ligase [Saccharicrinis fermentans]|uniref:D-alanine--D-alanine ligase n=1 Tax=Saccharicrinis fermentans DSM 9555 = JCM 21142 TaxID=869213 RepID=W7XW88_9BACT|nr:D-alanine--D-alanine ligase [Saccharicrinis fermentans]GAF02550.1 D-alanine-D-alanine ligase B [Saccharicrinis fermentans DSM 9555 = JCM 21142]